MPLVSYIAHYRSPDASAKRAKGLFEFESGARFGSKANAHDARVRMLELFGNDALSWNIEKIEKKKSNDGMADGQLELDFRDPVKKPKRKQSRKYL